MSIQIRVGGVWLSTIAAWGELQWSHAADGGCKEASWRMDLPKTFTHTSLVRPAQVEIKAGSANVWQGFLSEPDMDDDATFTAQGLSALGKDYLCFDGSLNTTSTPDTAVDQAISRGLPWVRRASLSSTAFAAGDQTDSLNYVGDLMGAWSDSVGKRWGVDADATVYAQADPTTPLWHLAPGSGRLGLADDDYASDIYVRYLAAGAGYATATAGDSTSRTKFGRREFPVDATDKGLLSGAAASLLGSALLEKGKARQGYTNGVEVTKYQLTYPGGSPAYLPFVKAGDLVRMHGVLSEQATPTPYVDWLIGETSYEAGSETITLTPAGLADRSLSEVMTTALGAA